MELNSLKERINTFEVEICNLQALNIIESSELAKLKNNIFHFFQNGINIIEKQNVLRIGIVGQMKVGKSSFLNSLFFDGQEILPKAATPMTAGLTVLEYVESDPHLDIEYFTAEEWKVFETYNEEYKEVEEKIRLENPNASDNIIRKLIGEQTTDIQKAAYEMVGKCDIMALGKLGRDVEVVAFESINDLQNNLNQYVGTGGMFTSVVKSITIHLNDDRLRGLQIIDTPGVNDPVSSREMRTREFLQTCHGVFFLSYSAQFFDAVDVSFLRERIGNQGIATVLMLASKFDVLLLNLIGHFPDDLPNALSFAYNSLSTIFSTNKAGLGCNNLNMQFDYTSGIGFSIASKDKSAWDNIERHIVDIMQRAFPSYFTNDEDLKDNFLFLSNFDKIKNDYLKKLFKDRKDEVIAQKLSGYFASNAQSLRFEIDRLQKNVNDKINILKQANEVELQNMQNSDEIFNALQVKLHNTFCNYKNHLQCRVNQSKDRELKNYLPVFWDEIPTLPNTFSVLHKGAMFGTRHSNFKGQIINKTKLRNELFDKIDLFEEKLSSFWEAMFVQLKNEILESFSEQLKEMNISVFSNNVLLDIFDRTLDSMNQYAILPLRNDYNVIDNSEVKSKNLIIKGWIHSKNELESDIILPAVYKEHFDKKLFEEIRKSEVQGLLDKQLIEIRNDLKNSIENFLIAVIDRFYIIADNQVNLMIGEIDELDRNILKHLKIEKDKYMKDLQHELQNKSISVERYENANGILSKLKEVLILN